MQVSAGHRRPASKTPFTSPAVPGFRQFGRSMETPQTATKPPI